MDGMREGERRRESSGEGGETRGRIERRDRGMGGRCIDRSEGGH